MIVSFYSYKGGVGRSQLCANIAAYLFFQKGKKVLLWDWDFEAPGLHYFFELKNENIKKKGTLELLEEYMVLMRKNADVGPTDLKFITKDENIIPLRTADSTNKKGGCIDLLGAGNYTDDFNWRANNFDWFEFYNMLDGANYIELVKENLNTLAYDYILIDSRTGISDYSGICNIQLPDVNVIVVAPTMQNFEGSKNIVEKIENAEYSKIKHKKPYILPILSRLDHSNPKFTEWVNRFTDYFSHVTASLDDEFDKEFLLEIFSDVYFIDTFLPYTPAISAGENILFSQRSIHTRSDFTTPFKNISEFLESINNTGSISFYKGVDENVWLEYAQIAKEKKENRKAAIAYTQIGLKQTDPNKKIKCYNDAIDLEPSYYLPHFYAGNNYLLKGEHDKAIEFYKKAINLNPHDSSTFYNLGIAYNNKGEYDKAIEYFNIALQLNPDDSNVLSNLGRAFGNKGEYDKAIEYYNKALHLNPHDTITINNLGLAYDNKGEYDKAIEYFNKALQLNPDDSNVLSNLGRAFGNKGEYDKAIEYYNKALQLKPHDTITINNLGLAYDNKGEYDKAVGYYNKALQLNPNDNNAITVVREKLSSPIR